MSSEPARRGFWRYFGVGLCWMASISLVDELSFRTWLVQRMEAANLDALFAGKARTVSPDVVVVSITDDDYKTEFDSASPLNPGKLQSLIDDILAENPKVLGVDFDTSLWIGVAPKYAGKPVVWAREILGDLGSLTLGKVLGEAGGVCAGVPAYFPDEDGTVRQYKQFIKEADARFYPSLAFNLAAVAKGGLSACMNGATRGLNADQSSELRKINFRGPKSAFDHLAISSLKALAPAGADGPKPLQNKIVLLGGSYRAARDAYPTPFRQMDGVDIIANTVDMLLPGRKTLNDFPMWLEIAGYVEGVILLAALYFVSRTWSLIVTLLTGPIYAVLVSWLAFELGGTFISFVPCFVGILIHECVEHTREYRTLKRENRELHARLAA